MGLSCGCSDIESDWYYWVPDGFTTLQTSRRRRCCSCNELIDIGSVCVRFERWCTPRSDIEEEICGDEVPLADWYMCEECGGLFFNFEELGFCVYLGDNMFDLLEEYRDLRA